MAAIQLADELEVKMRITEGYRRTLGLHSLATESLGAPFTDM